MSNAQAFHLKIMFVSHPPMDCQDGDKRLCMNAMKDIAFHKTKLDTLVSVKRMELGLEVNPDVSVSMARDQV